jgi:hypothetical protein
MDGRVAVLMDPVPENKSDTEQLIFKLAIDVEKSPNGATRVEKQRSIT